MISTSWLLSFGSRNAKISVRSPSPALLTAGASRWSAARRAEGQINGAPANSRVKHTGNVLYNILPPPFESVASNHIKFSWRNVFERSSMKDQEQHVARPSNAREIPTFRDCSATSAASAGKSVEKNLDAADTECPRHTLLLVQAPLAPHERGHFQIVHRSRSGFGNLRHRRRGSHVAKQRVIGHHRLHHWSGWRSCRHGHHALHRFRAAA